MSTIMIVDDSKFMRARLVAFLTQRGYQIVEAKDGEEAIQAYSQAHPGAVILDFAMPRKNGLITLREIRQLDSQARVIMLTAMGQKVIAIQAMQAGAKDFLLKPFENEQLLNVLQKVLR